MPTSIATSVVFQPIVDLMTGLAVGYEALGRLAGREQEGFAALQQQLKSQQERDRVMQELLRLSITRGAVRPPGTLLFINITRDLVYHYLSQSLGEPGSFQDVVLEVPEGDRTVMSWAHFLQSFREHGASVAVDDWGVGMADPLRVAELNPDWLKIDMALIRKVGRDSTVDRLIALVVNWVAHTHTKVVAEGVETNDQVLRLRQLGVRYGQGFGLARPSREFLDHVAVPAPNLRLGQIAGPPLALQEAYELCDEHLELIDSQRLVLKPLMEESLQQLALWIHHSQIAPHLETVSSVDHFCDILRRHFDALTRGYLGGEDVERARRIVEAHRRYSIDIGWFTLGYRKFQMELMRRLREQGHLELAKAMSELMTWDMGMIMSSFQETVDYDDATGLLRHQAFWRRASLDATLRVKRNERALLLVIYLGGLDTLRRSGRRQAARQLLTQVGCMLNRYQTGRCLVGHLQGDEFGVWTDRLHRYQLLRLERQIRQDIQEVSPDLDAIIARSTLVSHGTTLEALYAHADRSLSASPGV